MAERLSVQQRLFNAILTGDRKHVKFNIENGADINAKDSNGWSPLYMACDDGKFELVKYLLQNGAEINEKNGLNDWSSLHNAVVWGRLDIVKILHQNGADINTKSIDGKSPLDLAYIFGHLDISKYLKKAKKEGNISSSNDIMEEDYYSILGVEKVTPLTEELKRELKRAYQKLALKFHPDKNLDADAEEKFKKIKTAYEVLTDPQKKKVYDSSGEEGLKKKNFNKN